MIEQPLSSAAATDEIKAALRRRALTARASIDPALRASAGAAVAEHGAALVARLKPSRVSLFISVKGEIDTGPLGDRLAALGVALCLPVIIAKAQPLVFRAWGPGEPLEDKPFGLREPPASAEEVEPDLLFVPLAAFDRAGARVGYGGGFYDRTLEKLGARKPIHAIGLAFTAQEVDAVPTLPHDQPLDGVLTEAGFLPTTVQPDNFAADLARVSLADVVLVNESPKEDRVGDLLIFESVEAASCWLEPWWVKDHEGFLLTAEGQRLIASVDSLSVAIERDERSPYRPELARDWLRQFAAAVPSRLNTLADIAETDSFDELSHEVRRLIAHIGFTR